MAAKKPKLGTGKRFAAIEAKAAASGAKNPAAVAAAAGIAAHGKKAMRRWAAAGRRRAASRNRSSVGASPSVDYSRIARSVRKTLASVGITLQVTRQVAAEYDPDTGSTLEAGTLEMNGVGVRSEYALRDIDEHAIPQFGRVI